MAGRSNLPTVPCPLPADHRSKHLNPFERIEEDS